MKIKAPFRIERFSSYNRKIHAELSDRGYGVRELLTIGRWFWLWGLGRIDDKPEQVCQASQSNEA